MNIKVEASRFKEALSKVYRVVSTRPATPTLGGVLVESSGDNVRLSATDLEVGITSTFEGEVKREGSIVLPGKVLYNIVRTLKGEVELEGKGEKATIRSGRSYFELSGFSSSDFPFFPPQEVEVEMLIPGSALKEALLRTYFAASRDETRPVLTGILFSFSSGRLEVVATDGHRLSRDIVPGIGRSDFEGQYILPQKAVSELLRLLEKEDALFIPQGGNIVIRCGTTTLFSTLIEGEYPNYLQVIPKNFVSTMRILRLDFLEALERVSLVTSGVPVVQVTVSGGSLGLRAVGDLGVAEEEISARVEGEHFKVAFNSRYLLEALRVMKGEEVEMGLSGELSPARMVSPDQPFEYVLMPVRLQGE